MVPRAIKHLFDGIDDRMKTSTEQGIPSPQFDVTVEFIELYNEVACYCRTCRSGSADLEKASVEGLGSATVSIPVTTDILAYHRVF